MKNNIKPPDIIELASNDRRFYNFLDSTTHELFHTPVFKEFIEAAFGISYRFIAAVDTQRILTLLPVAEIQSRIFGNKLISSGYIEYGGFAGDEKYVPSILQYIKKHYKKKNRFLEIRGGIEKYDGILSAHLKKDNLYKRFVLDISKKKKEFIERDELAGDAVEDTQFSSGSVFGNVQFSSGSMPMVGEFRRNLQKSKRKAIHKARRDNVEVRDIPLADLNQLYDLYCRNMRSFGSPPYSKKYFVTFYRKFIDKRLGKIYGAYLNNKLIAALLGFCYGNKVHILISVSDHKFKDKRPNDAVHSEFIEWAIANDYTVFDFGRVREDSGQFEYKRKWGAELKELPSYFWLWRGSEMQVLDPDSVRYKRLVKVWQKLPLSITRLLGHSLRKQIGI